MANIADVREWGKLSADALNRAIAEGPSRILLPDEDIICEEPLVMERDRVMLIGAGPNSPKGVPVTEGYGWGTRLIQDFAGAPLLTIRSPFGPGRARKRGQGIVGVTLDANGHENEALLYDSGSLPLIKAHCRGSTGETCVRLTSGVDGEDLAESPCIQDGLIELYVHQIQVGPDTHCVTMDRSHNANVSYMKGPGCGIRLTCWHKHGRALYAKGGDNNEIMLRSFRNSEGTGAALWAGANRQSNDGFYHNEVWVAATGAAPIYAEGTNDAGVASGVTNLIHPDRANGTQDPVAGTGSRWVDMSNYGDITNAQIIKGTFAEARWTAALAQSLRGSETMHIHNTSGNHEVLSNGVAKWLRRIASNGDLDIIALENTGKLSLPHYGWIKLGGQTLALGEPDANGRRPLLLVPL